MFCLIQESASESKIKIAGENVKLHPTMSLSLIVMVLFSQMSFSAIKLDRCSRLNDYLQAHQAAGRRAWVSKCFPEYRDLVKSHEEFVDSASGEKYPGYPTFAFISDQGDLINPSNWLAPTREDAPCDYPQGYKIAGFCAP